MMPAEHKPQARRAWYKVKWIKNPDPHKKEWTGIEGKMDLIMQEDYAEFKPFVEVLGTLSAPMCTTGPGLRFGKTSEDSINEWIKKNGR